MDSISHLPPQVLDLICASCTKSERLARLAATCRPLSRYALPHLWHTIPCFAVLAFTLPARTYTVRTVECSTNQKYELSWQVGAVKVITFTGDLAPADLLRFHIYAPLVCRVVDTVRERAWRSHPILGPSTWRALEDVLLPGALPNLRSIWVTNTVGILPEPLNVFLGQRLEQLICLYPPLSAPARYIDEPEDPAMPGFELEDDRTGDLLRAIAHCETNNIRHFHWGMEVDPEALGVLLADAVGNMHRLRTYQASTQCPTQSRVLQSLGSLPVLENIQITLSMHDTIAGTHLGFIAPFPALCRTEITADCLQSCTTFFATARSSSLHSMDLLIKETDLSATEFAAFATVLGAHPSSPSLRSIKVTLGEDPYNPGKSLAVSAESFSPLFRLHSLQAIHFVGRIFACLDNAAIAEMASAWPALRSALLCSETVAHAARGAPGLPTLACLIPLARHCLQLSHIRIAMADVDRDEVHALIARPPPVVLSWAAASTLQYLGVQTAALRTEDFGSVAVFLTRHFPRLREVHFRVPYENYGNRISIDDFVRAIRQIRIQERNWGRNCYEMCCMGSPPVIVTTQ